MPPDKREIESDDKLLFRSSISPDEGMTAQVAARLASFCLERNALPSVQSFRECRFHEGRLQLRDILRAIEPRFETVGKKRKQLNDAQSGEGSGESQFAAGSETCRKRRGGGPAHHSCLLGPRFVFCAFTREGFILLSSGFWVDWCKQHNKQLVRAEQHPQSQ